MLNPNGIRLLVSAMLLLPAAAHAQNTSSASAMVVDIPQDALSHRPACPLVRAAGSRVKVMRQGEAERRGMKPHDCPVLADGTLDPNAVPVYVQEGDDRYHKDGCEKLGASATKTTLAEGAKGRWPCTTCRPPIRKPASGSERGQSGVKPGSDPGGSTSKPPQS